MSNRLLWILVLIGMFWIWYLYYSMIIVPSQQSRAREALDAQVFLDQKKNETKLIKEEIKDIELTKEEKIQFIREKRNSYKTFRFSNTLKAYFMKNDDSLDLYLDDKKIWNFDLVYSQYLRVEQVLGTPMDLYIEVWKDKFYYNYSTKLISKIELNIDILYVKVWTNNRLIFVTDKGSFIYSIYDKTLNFFSYFNDMVYINEWYVWLVQKDETRVLKNLWFEANKYNYIVYYNSKTKEKKIIYKTKLIIEKIYVEEGRLYLITDQWEKHKLNNI